MEIESDRLFLRHWRPEDFEAYAAFYTSKEASFVGGPCDRHQAWRRLAGELGHWALRGFGHWAVEEKDSGRFVGGCGLWFPEGWPELEVGYWLVPEMQGKGYATEAALRARRFAYEDLGMTTIVSYVAPANEASKRVAERLGARAEATIELVNFGPHIPYRHPAPEL